MFPIFVIFFYIFAAIWIGKVLRRLPNDLIELKDKLQKIRRTFDPVQKEILKDPAAYRKMAIQEFCSDLGIQVLILWPITAYFIFLYIRLIFFIALPNLVGLIRSLSYL